MRALLDIDVWIALLDEARAFAPRANAGFERERPALTTCPLTENGVVRIMASPGYSAKSRQPILTISALLRQACAANDHAFWPDDVSLPDAGRFDVDRLHGSRQIADAYLLALAVSKGGRFVAFGEAILLSAVRGATRRHLLVL